MAHPAWCLLEALPLSQSQETTIFKGGGWCTCACVGVSRDKRLLAVMSGDVRQVRGVWQAGRDVTGRVLIFQMLLSHPKIARQKV